jgi:hypothetical protein
VFARAHGGSGGRAGVRSDLLEAKLRHRLQKLTDLALLCAVGVVSSPRLSPGEGAAAVVAVAAGGGRGGPRGASSAALCVPLRRLIL